jgi:hypothetical protein
MGSDLWCDKCGAKKYVLPLEVGSDQGFLIHFCKPEEKGDGDGYGNTEHDIQSGGENIQHREED